MEVTPESLMIQIKTLETQIAILKAQVKRLMPETAPKTFADLYGILADAGDFTEEEIDAALYRLPEEDEELTEPGE